MARFHWEIETTCPQCRGAVFADGDTDDDPQTCAVQDSQPMCYQCGASFTIDYRTGAAAIDAQADEEAH